ncbi:MAG: hypothetical protein ACJ788_00095 [Ktedonobacteraceae bacterium]
MATISVPNHYSAFPERLWTAHDLEEFHMSHDFGRQHPAWILCLEDGTNLLSSQTTWNEHAQLRKEGDTFLPVIEKFATTCFIFPRDTNNSSIQVLRPPRPTHFFSFSRFVTSISDAHSIAIWRYSVFGYFFEDMRMTWHMYPEGTTECLLESRSAPIIL